MMILEYQISKYYGTLEYTLRKAFRVFSKGYMPREKFNLFCMSNDTLKSIFEYRATDINYDNVDEVIELLKKATGLNK